MKQVKVPWPLLTVSPSIGSGVVTYAQSKASLYLLSPLHGLMAAQNSKNPDGFFSSSWSDDQSEIAATLNVDHTPRSAFTPEPAGTPSRALSGFLNRAAGLHCTTRFSPGSGVE